MTMRKLRAHQMPRALMCVTAGLLFGDLFLRWQDVSPSTGVHFDEIAEGWHGWGAFAGILLMTIFVRAMVRALGSPLGALFDAVAALGVLVFVVERLRDTGDTTIGLTTIEVSANRWPAWIGLVLAVTLAVSSLAALVQTALDHFHRHFTGLHARPAA